MLFSACTPGRQTDLRHKSISEVAALLKNPDRSVRLAAATELSKRGTAVATIISELNSALDDADPYVQVMVLYSLGNAGTQTGIDIRKIIDLLHNSSPDVASVAANTLAKINVSESLDDLQKVILEREDYRIRIESIKSIISLNGASQSVPIFVFVLENDRDRTVKQNAIKGLSVAGKDAECAVPILVQYLKDDDMWFRAASAEAIAHISGNDTLIDKSVIDTADGKQVQVVMNINDWWSHSGQYLNYPSCQ